MLDAEQGSAHAAVVLAPGTHLPEIEALFLAARRRRRRRRLLAAAVSLALVGAAAFGVTVGGGGHGAAVRGGNRPPVTVQSQSPRLALPAVGLACVENGSLVIADPATGAMHVGPAVDASSSGPLVWAAGHLYWADASTDGAPIRDYDLAKGKIRHLARGDAVFASADGRNLYIVRDSRTLLEMPPDGYGRAVVLTAPVGWFMSRLGAGWAPEVTAGGVIVSSSDSQNYVPPTARAGLWDPATGQVRILGVGIDVFGVYTGAEYSLVAWATPNRDIAQDYSLRIVNTSTGVTTVARSRYGFVAGGAPAFSPDGTQMAVFVRTAPLGSSNGMSQLAIVGTRSGTVRLVPGTALYTMEDAFWAMWLPLSHRILAGAMVSAYAVDARTLTVRPFSFLPSNAGFSAVVVPVRR